MLEQSKTKSDNPAGFLIKALREDWTTPATFQAKKNDEFAAQKKKEKAYIASLEAQKKQLSKEFDELRKPIFNELLLDPKEVQEVFNIVVKTQLYKDFIEPNLSPLENYHKSYFLQARMDKEFEKRHSPLFSKSNQILEKIKVLDKQIEKLK